MDTGRPGHHPAALFERLPAAMIVASDPSVADEMSGMLGFAGLRSERVTPAELGTVDRGPGVWSVIVLCGMPSAQALEAIDEWHSGPHVVTVGFDQAIPERLHSLHSRLLGRIRRPLRHAQMAPILAQLVKPKSNGGAATRDAELFRALVGQSEPIQQLRRKIARVAPSDSTVLILGETGTGKEVVARHIHYQSQRRGGPFVAVNCGAIPADLLESELFGHEKGAFTGALAARKGRFELAEGGTLFLDEIGDMTLQMQVKLLRVLQERCFERLGGGRSMVANVRIVCATHRELDAMVQSGTFRADLYYRINVFPIEMPALRERAGDLPLLASELVSRLVAEGRPPVSLAPDAIAALERHTWPGNVRELANLVERMSIMHPGEVVTTQDLPRHLRELARPEDLALNGGARAPDQAEARLAALFQPADDDSNAFGLSAAAAGAFDEPEFGPGRGLKDYLNDIEEQLIRKALAESGGTVADAAKSLGMRRTTLVEKLRKFGIDRLGFATDS